MGGRTRSVAAAERVSIAHLLDHSVRIHRPTITRGAVQEELTTYTAGALTPAGVRRPRARYGDAGPGTGPIGERVVYFDAGVDVLARDVIELVSGPDAPGLFEVDAPPTSPRGHHIECTCRHFVGRLS